MLLFVTEFYAKLRFGEHYFIFKESSGLAKITLVLSRPVSSSFKLTIISASLTHTLSNKGEDMHKYVIYVLSWYLMDSDYEHGPFYVTFHANQTSVSFNVSLNDDNEVEKDETFRLEILDPILPNNAKLLDHSCKVTIVDTTSKSVIRKYSVGTL